MNQFIVRARGTAAVVSSHAGQQIPIFPQAVESTKFMVPSITNFVHIKY
jgi:hypothetical protein